MEKWAKHLNRKVTCEEKKIHSSNENLLNFPQQRHEKEN